MPFSTISKVNYDNLAPSLQAMFKHYTIDDYMPSLYNQAQNGQLLKIFHEYPFNTFHFRTGDGFFVGRVVDNNDDLEKMKNTKVNDENDIREKIYDLQNNYVYFINHDRIFNTTKWDWIEGVCNFIQDQTLLFNPINFNLFWYYNEFHWVRLQRDNLEVTNKTITNTHTKNITTGDDPNVSTEDQDYNKILAGEYGKLLKVIKGNLEPSPNFFNGFYIDNEEDENWGKANGIQDIYRLDLQSHMSSSTGYNPEQYEFLSQTMYTNTWLHKTFFYFSNGKYDRIIYS